MALLSMESVAFDRPGGEACVPSKSRPIDLVHLSRQTMGDRSLEQEVLSMFVTQAGTVRDRICAADLRERRLMAHNLKGAARGVGAFPVAEAAGAVETDPEDRHKIRRLAGAIESACQFIAAISR